MKKKFVFILTAIMLCLAFALSACGETGGGNNANNGNNGNTNHDDGTYYTVTFDSQGGSNVESKRVLAGNPVAAPASPTRDNFDFGGWYKSADKNAGSWNFSTDRVNGDLTLYAHWTAKEQTPTPSDTLTFEKSMAGEGYIVTGDSGQAANIVIPEKYNGEPVVGIAESAFGYAQHKSDILSVTIPDSVTEIGRNAFHNQSALVSVHIGTGSKLQKIGNNAFSGNSSLESIYLPAGLSELGDDVFNNCGALNAITVAAGNPRYSGAGNCLIELATGTLIRGSNHSVIPETVTKIGVAAFRRATLTALSVPASVTVIEKYAFSDSSIVTIDYKGTQEAWNRAVRDENGKERMWKSSKQDITVYCADTQTSNILVAYFSATGNTEKVAGYIAQATSGTLYEIVPQVPYTQEDLNYNDSTTRATVEQRDSNARPAINGSVENMASYDVIFLGYPIWHGAAPKIIYTFLESYSFSGKTIIPFCTSASSLIGSSATNLHSLAPNAEWKEGRRFPAGTSQNEVDGWVDSLGLVSSETSDGSGETAEMIFLTIGSRNISVKLEKNVATSALAEILKGGDISYTAHDYGGFEKVGSLGQTLPRDDRQMTAEAGDVVLYAGDQIVLFYGSNAWSYTKLGRVQGISAEVWKDLLTQTDSVTVTLRLR